MFAWLVAPLPRSFLKNRKKGKKHQYASQPSCIQRCSLKHHAMPQENTQPLAPHFYLLPQRENGSWLSYPNDALHAVCCPLAFHIPPTSCTICHIDRGRSNIIQSRSCCAPSSKILVISLSPGESAGTYDAPSPSTGLFIICGGLYDPRFCKGLPTPTGMPTFLALSAWGLTKFVRGGMTIAAVAAGDAPMASVRTGLLFVWSTPAVLRIEGLSW